MNAIATIFFLFAAVGIYSQNLPWCASDKYLKEMLASDPVLKERFESERLKMQQYLSSGNKRGSRALVTIPVVVHVIHDGDSIGGNENISDAQVRSQIDALNIYYRNQNPGLASVPAVFRSLAADFEVEFCLAQRDPLGNPTSGIERINGGRNSWNRTQADQFKPSTIWNPSHYLNIWTMRLGGTDANTLGYAQFPGMADSTDGVVIDYVAFGTIGNVLTDYNMGKTTTHEIGHWLGLYHIWGDDAGDCIAELDDGVNDTPMQGLENYGCPSFPHISCNNGPNGDMFMNYMDYTDDACSSMFTAGQKAVADYTFSSARDSLLSSPGCTPTTANQYDCAITDVIFPTGEICTDAFVPLIRVRNHGSATITSVLVNYQVDGGDLRQFYWYDSMATYAYNYITLPQLTLSLSSQHSLYIYVSIPNGATDQNPNNDQITVDFTIASTGTGLPVPASEGFESGALPSTWEIQNPNNDRKWEATTAAGANGSFSSVSFDNFTGVAVGTRGRRDGLITPDYDFSTPGSLYYITFDVAYARRNSASYDSLILYYSLDCGYSWSRMWAKGGAGLATASDSAAAFTPQAGEWREEKLWLGILSRYSRVKFKFENYSDFGNNIFIDDFKVGEVYVGIGNNSLGENVALEIAPNPNDGQFKLTVSMGKIGDFYLEIFNVNGQRIKEYFARDTNKWSETIDLSRSSKGLYFARLTSDDIVAYKKIVVK